MKIMFICTGNICRSAMAHWLFEKKLQDNKIENIKIYSCGIYAQNGDVSTYEAKRVMKEYEVDISKHRATNIRNSNIEQMDLVLCATQNHKIAVLDIFPKLEDRIYTMKEYVNYKREYHNPIDIKDPWGYDIDTYRSCAGEIDECLELLIQKINRIQKGENNARDFKRIK